MTFEMINNSVRDMLLVFTFEDKNSHLSQPLACQGIHRHGNSIVICLLPCYETEQGMLVCT